MIRTLDDLVSFANDVFPDDFVGACYRRGSFEDRPIELLAQFIVSEISDLYDPASNDRENLSRMIANLEIASERIAAVTQRFQELQRMALA